ncbi:serine hydrolase domain-containing protein [Mycolicibacterium sp. 120270]|uniref:serine hydrolase domain-containing protein n=1 Tax=Mycolicibacterium sp. 120270 TaxID=3090600 RepID=UPI00299EC045|nr:serine hydrolase domain-containing protein [Mycolicibacterium sp. 120270]MDX1886753.1 serine hydrolase domain-containing protein [Mycolicibacterium sp. 120270]
MTAAVHGHVTAPFDKVAKALAEEIDSGNEVGASIAVDIDGETVLDIWGGHADEAKSVEWGEDTIINVWSSTKTVTSLAALILADRGLLDLDAPVATYWPEFATNGKHDVRVRHLLSHTSGVAGWQEPVEMADLYDWDKATSLLAAQAPWWEPGTASGYQALNFGFLIGELVRRTAGMSLKDFVRDEIAGPLEADFQIGARPEDAGRIAELIPPPPFDIPFDQLPEDNPTRKTLTNPAPEAEVAHTAAWRESELGAVNGHGNARSLARMLSPISLGGTANNVRLLTQPTIERIFDVQSHGPDLVLMVPLKMGIGLAIGTPEVLPFMPPEEKVCFWGGWGGSMVLMNPERRTTVAYVMNKMGQGTLGNERTARYGALIYEALS